MELEDRLQQYREILQENPAYTKALARFREAELSDADRLFLHSLAPVMVTFVEWVLQTAKQEGRKRLYFLSRDGWMMYQTARQICEAKGEDIDCRYLHVSRYAMRQPQYHLLGEECLDLICVGGIDTTFDKLMKRAGLTPEETQQIAEAAGFAEKRKNILHYRQVQELKETLRHVPLLLPLIYRHSEEAWPAAAKYLRQEGLLEDGPFALVDSGWIGTLQQSIAQLREAAWLLEKPKDRAKRIPLRGYYFGLYETPTGADETTFCTHYFSPNTFMRRKNSFSNCLFEAVFSAPEGMIIGYRQNSDTGLVDPIQSRNVNPNGEELMRWSELLNQFTDYYLQAGGTPAGKGGAVLSEKILALLMARPTAEEVEQFGNLLFCDDVLELQMQKVAADLSAEEIRRQRFFNKVLIMLGVKKEVIYESAWLEGSIVRNGEHVAANLRHAAFYKFFVYLRKARKHA